jgi:hypothetical protein
MTRGAIVVAVQSARPTRAIVCAESPTTWCASRRRLDSTPLGLYEDFSETTDDEVRRCQRAPPEPGPPATVTAAPPRVIGGRHHERDWYRLAGAKR